MRFNEHKGQLMPMHVQPCLKITRILAEKSAMFSYFSLTGMRHSGENIPGEDLTIDPLKKRVLGRTIIQNYLASVENEKAAQIALCIVIAFVKSNKRWYMRKKVGAYSENNPEKLYQRLIGGELLRLCCETNLFTRLLRALDKKQIGKKPVEHFEHLINVTQLLRYLLMAQDGPATLEQVEKVRLFQILRIVVTQAFSLQQHVMSATASSDLI